MRVKTREILMETHVGVDPKLVLRLLFICGLVRKLLSFSFCCSSRGQTTPQRDPANLCAATDPTSAEPNNKENTHKKKVYNKYELP